MGREDELARFDRIVAELETGSCQVLEVVGDPGMGKTWLLGELANRARMAGHTVAIGQAGTPTGRQAFELFVDALEDPLLASGGGLLDHLDGRVIRALGSVFPSLGSSESTADNGAENANHYWTDRAIRAALDHLCRTTNGLVLLLDDVHRADKRSLELLHRLTRKRLPASLLLVVSHRPRQAPAMLINALARGAFGATHRFELASLSFDEAVRLMPAKLCPAHRRASFHISAGNPGVLHALTAASDQHSPDAWRADGEGSEPLARIPQVAVASDLLDLHNLSPVGRLVAHAAAVVGNRFNAQLVADVVPLGIAETLAGIDELVGHDLVRADDPDHTMRFRHPVVRAACYHDGPSDWRRSAHQRAEAALRKQNASATERAWHIARSWSGEADGRAGILLEAARQLGDAQPACVSSWLRLLRQVPSRTHEMCEADLLAWHARTTALAGGLVESLHIHRQALQFAGELSAPARASLVVWSAQVCRLLGHYDEAKTLLSKELSGGRPVQDQLLVTLAQVELEHDQPALLGLPATLAEIAARADPASAIRAMATRTAVLVELDRFDEALRQDFDTVQALDQPDEHGPESDVVARVDALYWLGWAELHHGRYDDSLRHFARGLALVERTGLTLLRAQLDVGLGTVQLRMRDPRIALQRAENANCVARAVGSNVLQTMALTLQSRIAYAQGDIASSERLASEAVAIAPRGRHRIDALDALAHARNTTEPETQRLAGNRLGHLDLVRKAAVDVPALPPSAPEVVPVSGGFQPDKPGVSSREGLGLLSDRELQVAKLVSRGRTNQQIARALVLSHKTVETYLRRIFDKLEVSCRSEVANLIGASSKSA